MASVAAATSASRRRRTSAQMIKVSQRRAKIANDRQELKAHALHVFEDLSRDGEWLDRDGDQQRAFLMAVFGTRKLNEHAAQLVLDTAAKKANSVNSNRSGALPKRALVDSVVKYDEYLSNRKTIEDLFQKYHKALDGGLGRSELRRLLQDKEQKAHRASRGISITLVVSPKDLDHVLQQADADRDGQISRAELLPALAAWEERVQQKLERKKLAGSCTIM